VGTKHDVEGRREEEVGREVFIIPSLLPNKKPDRDVVKRFVEEIAISFTLTFSQ
jgi:hypothetical protein